MDVLTHPLLRVCIVSLAGFVRDQVGGALSYAAVQAKRLGVSTVSTHTHHQKPNDPNF
jgi:hypothetical protein